MHESRINPKIDVVFSTNEKIFGSIQSVLFTRESNHLNFSGGSALGICIGENFPYVIRG